MAAPAKAFDYGCVDSATPVFLRRNWLKMGGIAAARIAAQMIDMQTGGDGATKCLICDTVHKQPSRRRTVTDRDSTVSAFVDRALPFPASTRCNRDPRLDSLCEWSDLPHHQSPGLLDELMGRQYSKLNSGSSMLYRKSRMLAGRVRSARFHGLWITRSGRLYVAAIRPQTFQIENVIWVRFPKIWDLALVSRRGATLHRDRRRRGRRPKSDIRHRSSRLHRRAETSQA
jgi:hypothetical protein